MEMKLNSDFNLFLTSIGRLHGLAPGAVHGCTNVVVPVVPQGSLVAEFALDGL